jgi:hypothetical protein
VDFESQKQRFRSKHPRFLALKTAVFFGMSRAKSLFLGPGIARKGPPEATFEPQNVGGTLGGSPGPFSLGALGFLPIPGPSPRHRPRPCATSPSARCRAWLCPRPRNRPQDPALTFDL